MDYRFTFRNNLFEYAGRRNLRGLMEPLRGPCLSFFLPHPGPLNRTPLLALLRSAERQLEQQACSRARMDELLQPLRPLVEPNLLPDLTEGVAMFRAPGFLRCFRLPFRVPEVVAVADSFCLRPLHPLFETSGRAYLLVVQRTGARLFWVDRKMISELTVPEPDDSSSPLQEELMTAVSPGVGTAAGRLDWGEEVAENTGLVRTAPTRQVSADTLACKRSCDHGVPVILAGPDYLCHDYRKLSRCPDILEEEIRGTPADCSPEELQRQAWAIASVYFSQARRRAVDRYHQYWHTLRASNDMRTIVKAARRGMVDVLFVAEDLLATDPVDPATGDVIVPSRFSTGEEDLLNLAARDTFMKGGAVYSMPRGQVPGRGSAAAVFSY